MTILVGYAPRAEARAALNKAIDIARTAIQRRGTAGLGRVRGGE